MTDDTFFRDEANRRINMLKKYYLMYVDDEDVFYFIRAGAPHYYYIDIYSTKLTFYDKDNVVIKEVTMQGRTQGDSLVSGNLPKETEKVEWTVVTDYYDVQMGELTIRRDAAYSLEVITNQFYIEGNKITQNRGLTYVNGSEASRIDISGDLIDVLDYNAIYGIELESLEALKEYNLGIVLYDSAGTSISRYLPALVEGKNLAVFSLTGFRENFATDLVDIKEFTLRIYLEELESMDIKIGNLYKFDNPFELYKYLQESQYKINFGN